MVGIMTRGGLLTAERGYVNEARFKHQLTNGNSPQQREFDDAYKLMDEFAHDITNIPGGHPDYTTTDTITPIMRRRGWNDWYDPYRVIVESNLPGIFRVQPTSTKDPWVGNNQRTRIPAAELAYFQNAARNYRPPKQGRGIRLKGGSTLYQRGIAEELTKRLVFRGPKTKKEPLTFLLKEVSHSPTDAYDPRLKWIDWGFILNNLKRFADWKIPEDFYLSDGTPQFLNKNTRPQAIQFWNQNQHQLYDPADLNENTVKLRTNFRDYQSINDFENTIMNHV